MVPAPRLQTEPGSVDLCRQLSNSGYVVISAAFDPTDSAMALSAAESLFGLDHATKLGCVADSPFSAGFSPYGRALAGDTGVPNLLESWTVAIDHPAGIPDTAEAAWTRLAHFGAGLRSLALECLRSIERGMRVEGESLVRVVARPETVLLLDYPAALVESNAGAARRQSIHTDASIITLLPRASREGLRVQVSGEWQSIHPPADGVVVLAGSALELLTEGLLKACVHTVDTPVASGDNPSRTAIVLFASARADTELASVMTATSRTVDAVSAAEHRDSYFKDRFAW